SSLKYLMLDSRGFIAVWPSPQREVSLTSTARSSMRSISPSLPFPAAIFISLSISTFVPNLHGGHLPQDSSEANSRTNFVALTMQFRSLITAIPPDPTIAPNLVISSYVTGTSRRCSGIKPPVDPPTCTAFNVLPFSRPPPTSYMIERRLIPMGTSMRPVLFKDPVKVNILVPGDASVPTLRYQSAPWRII